MTERNAVAAVERPATIASITLDLRLLGLDRGDTVIVHSSLSRLGYVAGGVHAVVLALLEAVGSTGTIAMPTHSGDLSDPAAWRNPPVPEPWWDDLREAMPPYDPVLTPTRSMGAIVECFRHVRSVRRSAHPTVSVAAVGPDADLIVDGHVPAYGLGERSPLGRLYDLDAKVLLLGVTHANNTSLHLAEYRSDWPDKPWTTHSSPVRVDGQRRWISYPDLEGDEGDFETLGEAFAVTGVETQGLVGAAAARLMRQRAIVDFAVAWMDRHRR